MWLCNHIQNIHPAPSPSFPGFERHNENSAFGNSNLTFRFRLAKSTNQQIYYCIRIYFWHVQDFAEMNTSGTCKKMRVAGGCRVAMNFRIPPCFNILHHIIAVVAKDIHITNIYNDLTNSTHSRAMSAHWVGILMKAWEVKQWKH